MPGQEALEDSPVPMDQSGDSNNNLLGKDMVDYEASLQRASMKITIITYSVDYTIIGDDEPVDAQFDFGPEYMIFTKPKESFNHLKLLFVHHHIDGTPISRMLIDRGVILNLMPYSLYRKLGKHDSELIRTTMMFNGVRSDSPIKTQGVTSIKLTIRTMTLATAFFVAEIEGNCSIVLDGDWIHANQCVSSTLHQMLLQWVGNEVEIVHADTSACIAMVDAPVLCTYDTTKCLIGVDFSFYQFISVCKYGFTLVMLEPMGNRLNHK
jgi:hypothetical protein